MSVHRTCDEPVIVKDRVRGFNGRFRKTVISLKLNVCLKDVIHHLKGNVFLYLMMLHL